MSFTDIAQAITSDAATLDEYFRNNSIPQPSFSANGPTFPPFTTKAAIHARTSLLANAHKISVLSQGPTAPWLGRLYGSLGDVLTTAAIYHFGIVEHVPLDGEATFEEVAQKSGLALRDFEIVVRYAMTNFIFCEPRAGFIAHTASSRVLKENKLVRSLMGMNCNELFPSLAKEIEALEEHPGSEEPTESGWAIANDAKVPIFGEFATQHPKRAETMSFALETVASMLPESQIVNAYDWASLGNATIVDAGGGKGYACRQLAKHFPKLSFIVQDLEDTAKAGRDTCPAEFVDRIRYMTQSFFTTQTVQADVYFFRAIFHNWPDKCCLEILRNLIPVLKKGARVIIQDPHTPAPLTMAPWQEREVRASNLRMKLLFNAHDRQSSEWPSLFAEADSRFKVVKNEVHERQPPNDRGPTLALVEAVWEG